MKITQKIYILALVALLSSGCSTNMLININAIADKTLSKGVNKYIFRSDMSEVGEDDLYFKEYSSFFGLVLQKNGYIKAASLEEADMVIKFKYAVSDGRTDIRSYRFPVYEHIGGYSYPLMITTTDSSGNVTTTSKTFHIPSRTVYVGSETRYRSYTLYNRTASLQAVLATKGVQTDKLVWQTQIYTVSESNDLRQAMPFFAHAAKDFLGKNSGEQRIVELKPKDPAVLALKKSLQ